MLKKAPFVILLCIIILCACGTKNGTKGQTADSRDFTLTSLDGEEFTLSTLKGKVVFVDFWATWCPPCRSSIPVLMSLYDKYRDRGFIALGISNEDKSTLMQYRSDNNINYPILIGVKNIMQAYGVQSIPNMYIFNKKGEIAKHQVGFSPEMEAMFDAFIDSLLSE
jgi:cytochrome c biogenesis protein CcmG/thiol:disulfide interchange protein DsbE